MSFGLRVLAFAATLIASAGMTGSDNLKVALIYGALVRFTLGLE